MASGTSQVGRVGWVLPGWIQEAGGVAHNRCGHPHCPACAVWPAEPRPRHGPRYGQRAVGPSIRASSGRIACNHNHLLYSATAVAGEWPDPGPRSGGGRGPCPGLSPTEGNTFGNQKSFPCFFLSSFTLKSGSSSVARRPVCLEPWEGVGQSSVRRDSHILGTSRSPNDSE